MDKVQKKLVQGIFELWNMAQLDEEKVYSQDIPDIGFVSAKKYVLIRLPKGCPHPFKADRKNENIRQRMRELITDSKAERVFDIGETKIVGENIKTKKFIYGTEGQEILVSEFLYEYLPLSAKSIDVYDDRVLRAYIEGEELPVVIVSIIKNPGVMCNDEHIKKSN